MACLICGSERTIRSHLIPACFAKDVRAASDSDIAVTVGATENFRPSKSGKFDMSILCEYCDGVLGKYESYSFHMLSRLNLQTSGITPGIAVKSNDIDKETFLRFCAGIAWKYAVAKKDLGRIEIGPYKQRLQEVAFSDAVLPHWIDVILFRLGTPEAGSTFYREPHTDRQLGVNIVRFSLCHFVIFLKIDQRKPFTLPNGKWLRASEGAEIPVVPFDLFEDGAVALRLKSPGTRTHGFLHRNHQQTDL